MRVASTAHSDLTGTTLVTVTGSLDSNGSEAFMTAVSKLVTSETPSVLLDFTEVEWVSSAGVGALVRLYTATQSQKGAFAMHGCSPRIRTVLRICGLEDPLNVRDTADAARDRLRELCGG